jgi:hypothetical protein
MIYVMGMMNMLDTAMRKPDACNRERSNGKIVLDKIYLKLFCLY